MFALVNKKRASIDRQYRFLFLLTHSNDAASGLDGAHPHIGAELFPKPRFHLDSRTNFKYLLKS